MKQYLIKTPHTFDRVEITLNGCGETLPTDDFISGYLRISSGCKQFAFVKAAKARSTANPLLFRGRYLNCRQKKNGNYQITCPIPKDIISKFTTAEGKVNLTEVFRYQSAELRRAMIAIEKTHNVEQDEDNEKNISKKNII